MYRVILAEDEPLMRMGIKSMVNWEALDMRVVAECSDGAEAWAAYEMHSPDLIITDLKMPVMDGMELIRKIRAVDKRVRILVLTGIEDFDYARQAVEYDVNNYTLKLSCTEEKFTGILKHALKELREMDALGGNHADMDSLSICESMFFNGKSPERDYPGKIVSALSIIRKDFDKPISLQSVADDLNVSAGHLSRLFLSAMGRTFTDTLNQIRVERAKTLLRDRKLTAYRVGEIVGIGNATYFIRVFKKYTGETPNEYRSKFC